MKRTRKDIRQKKHKSIRNKIAGTPERPRLTVYRSLQNVYAQIIDDLNAQTLVCASTLDKELRGKQKFGGNIAGSKAVGKLLAERALKKKIGKVVFDRGGLRYHGRIKALADAAREHGLKF